MLLHLLPFAVGCRPAISDAELRSRLDSDRDGYDLEEDCDDLDAEIGPPTPWYQDLDTDGYGAASVGTACVRSAGAVARDGDCDDEDPAVHPGAREVCNTADDDCDRVPDSPLPLDAPAWYPDDDGDAYGVEPAINACDAPAGHVSVAGDCDDANVDRSPGAIEVCENGVDDDCDGLAGTCGWPAVWSTATSPIVLTRRRS